MSTRLIISAILALLPLTASAAVLMPGFERGLAFNEQIKQEKTDDGVRILINAPETMHADLPTLVVFYATPNGNTIEQTMGCGNCPDLDWHFDIQHAAAQTRRMREVDPGENIVLICMQAEEKSWPAWRQKHSNNAPRIRELVEKSIKDLPGKEISVALTGHSGGGSMVFGFINAAETIPPWVKRIAFLDSNYGYDDEQKHGDKLLTWLRANPDNRLVVVAYDDRDIMLDGKRVVSSTGGTFRASHRMLNRFERELIIDHMQSGDIDHYRAMDGRINFFIHRNPKNKILHTALVGEMNGYLQAMGLGTGWESKWGTFGGPRAYTKWIEPSPMTIQAIPPCSEHAEGGKAIMKRISQAPLAEREPVILSELKRGNVPAFLRSFITIKTEAADANGKVHKLSYEVAPDYLAIGTDKDFVRVPLTPMTAQPAADAFNCILPTRKMVNDIYRQAEVKLEPRPLTQAREAIDTFVQHNDIIEGQRSGKHLGALVAGIKKDVVITNKLLTAPKHVAIYGWHKLDGNPIQPLTTVHKDYYVDYSHGIRLVKRMMLVDGQPRDICDVLSDPVLHTLLSDEGPVTQPRY